MENDKENIPQVRNVTKKEIKELKTLQIDPLGLLKKKQNILK